MKKLVLMLAVVFSMSFFACGNKEQAAEATEEAAVVEEVAEVVDTTATPCDSAAACCDSAAAVVAEVVEAPAAE
ncbi:MAG: hypothetical protein NC418_10620 [Muribaculaceae bacterium]|nr:hypothetical protein [Muribaculaceae bacterium]